MSQGTSLIKYLGGNRWAIGAPRLDGDVIRLCGGLLDFEVDVEGRAVTVQPGDLWRLRAVREHGAALTWKIELDPGTHAPDHPRSGPK